MPKVDLKSIGREIRRVQKQVKSTRSRTGPEANARLSELIDSLDRLYVQTVDCCPKGMAGEVVALKKPARKATRKATRPKRRTR
jgi:hypothetical protein